jgi:peroxiredoxin
MNRSIRTFLTLAFLLPGAWLSAQKGYRIEVRIGGFQQQQLFLAYHYGDKQYLRDTAERKDGAFVFEGEEPMPGGIYLVVMPPKNNYFEVILDQDQHFSIETDTLDLVQRMKIKGCPENELFYQDLQFLGSKRKEMNDIQAQLKQAAAGSEEEKRLKAAGEALDKAVTEHRKRFIAEHPSLFYTKVLRSLEPPQVPEAPKDENGKALDSLFAFKYYRRHFFDQVDFTDDRMLRTPVLMTKVNEYIDKLTYRMPDSINQSIDYIIAQTRPNDDVYQYFVIHFLNKYAQSKIMGMDAVYVHMVENYYLDGKAWWADSATVAKMEERARAISPTLVGRPAPDFYAQDVNGRTQHPHGIKAKYTILYFWDYDCSHCKKVTPQLAALFPQYKDYDVKLFAVSINGDVEVWKQKLAEYKLDQPNVINVQDHARRSGFDSKYDILSTPRIFLLNEDKSILAKQISVEQVEEILNHELGLPAPVRAEAAEGEAEESEE